MGVFGQRFNKHVVQFDIDSIPGKPNVDVNVVVAAMTRGSATGLAVDRLYMQCWCVAFDLPVFVEYT